MSDGMRGYWQARRAQEQERIIKTKFYDLVQSLLHSRYSHSKLIRDLEEKIDKFYSLNNIVRGKGEMLAGSAGANCPLDSGITAEQAESRSSR